MDTFGGSEKAIKEAASLLKNQHATYRNFWVDKDSELAKFTKSFAGYPITYVVDRNGQIAGEPILRGIDNGPLKEELDRQIKKTTENDKELRGGT